MLHYITKLLTIRYKKIFYIRGKEEGNKKNVGYTSMKVYENIALSDYHNYIKYLDIDYNLYEIHVNVNVCTDIETD